MKKILRFLIPVLILAIAISGFMALKISKESRPVAQSEEVVWRVKTIQATLAENNPHLTLYGTTEAATFTEIKSTLTAEVINVLSHEGDHLKKGDLLAELDSRESALLVAQRQAEIREIGEQIKLEEIEYQANLDTLSREQQLLQLKKNELDRIKRLKGGSMVSQSAIDQTQQEVENRQIKIRERRQQIDQFEPQKSRLLAQKERLQALLAQRELDLQRAKLFAPYSAIIHKVPVAPGGRVRSGDTVISIYDPESIRVRAQIPRTAIEQIRSGLDREENIQMVGMVDNGSIQAILTRLVSDKVDEVGGVAGIFEIKAADTPPLPGRALELSVTLPAVAETIVIPYEALYENSRIYRVDADGRLEPVVVENLGWGNSSSIKTRDDSESMIVIGGSKLRNGDRIVTTHLPEAMKGIKVSYE